MKQVLETRKDVAFFIKLFPLKIHKDAKRKSESIMCEKSLEMLEDAFAKKPIPDPSCKTDIIDKNIVLAAKLGITGTPALIFGDGTLARGYIKADKLIELIDRK